MASGDASIYVIGRIHTPWFTAVPTPAQEAPRVPGGPARRHGSVRACPNLLLGWPRANHPEERDFLLPDIGAGPELERLMDRGNLANLGPAVRATLLAGIAPDQAVKHWSLPLAAVRKVLNEAYVGLLTWPI